MHTTLFLYNLVWYLMKNISFAFFSSFLLNVLSVRYKVALSSRKYCKNSELYLQGHFLHVRFN